MTGNYIITAKNMLHDFLKEIFHFFAHSGDLLGLIFFLNMFFVLFRCKNNKNIVFGLFSNQAKKCTLPDHQNVFHK